MDKNYSSRKIISFHSHRSIYLAFLMKFSFFISKKASFGGFSFESYYAHDGNNCRSFSSIVFVLVRFILQKECYSLDEELQHDVTCWMISATFSNFLRS
jgi:hypothetical protein